MAGTQDLQRAITALKTANTKLANGHGKSYRVEDAQRRLREELKQFWGESTPALQELRRRAKEAFQASDWQLVVAMLGRNGRRERRPKPKRESPCSNGRGQLSPFAGQPPERWQAEAEMSRRRAVEAAGAVSSQRGIVIPGKKDPKK